MAFKFSSDQPVIDSRGCMTPEFLRAFNSLLARVGGGSKVGPSAPTGLTYSIEAGGVRLQCDANPAAEEVTAYVWRVGATWADSLLLVNFSSNNELIPSDQVGTYTIWVAAADVRGNFSTPSSMEVVVTDADLGLYGPKVTLTSTGLAFANGSPASIDITALLLNLPSPTFVWTVDGVVDAGATNGTYTVSAFTGTEKVYRCTVTSGVSGLSAYGETTIYAVADGAAGARGSLKGYGTQYSISVSAWSDAKANRVISNMLTGATGTTDLATTDHLRIGDTVQLTNGSDFVESRHWTGSAWLTAAVVIEGNVLVNGTGTFTGNLNVGGSAVIDGSNTVDGATCALFLNSATARTNGAIAYSGASGGAGLFGVGQGGHGVEGSATAAGKYGVYGLAKAGGSAAAGVYGWSGLPATPGVYAINSSGSGLALKISGKMEWGSSTWTSPSGTGLLCADGSWVAQSTFQAAGSYQAAGNYATDGTATSYVLYGTQVAGTGVATFDGTAKPGGNTTNAWLKFVINGTTYYIPVWA